MRARALSGEAARREKRGRQPEKKKERLPAKPDAMPLPSSLSIRPSYGVRGEEILDGGGGRGRRNPETPDTQATPVSRLQSRAWSFACLGRFARRTKKRERLLVV